MTPVTVAIPTLNGGSILAETLEAVLAQRLEPEVSLQLLVCDSGSRDGSAGLARRLGADVFEIPSGSFSHGATRNLLMERAEGDRVAFLTQDAVPADDLWLARLLGAFDCAQDVALTYGPYRPRCGASPMVARELGEWFRSFSPDGRLRIDRLAPGERSMAPRALLGPRGFFTDANGCVSRAAWQSVRFRNVPYAEDHLLAHDMLRAGYAKVFVPDAAVLHSHDYTAWRWLRRSFDEARALRELYGFVPSGSVGENMRRIRGLVGADVRWARARGQTPPLLRSFVHHALRRTGEQLGARADRLPAPIVRRISLERR
jgi:rhamnosyltransferase